MRYLDDDWLQAADGALSSLEPLSSAVSVGFQVRSGKEPDRSYQLILGPDRVGVERGLDGCGVRLVLDWDLAVAIATGVVSAQRAFLDGNIQLGGDASLLLGHQDELARIDDRLADLRTITQFN